MTNINDVIKNLDANQLKTAMASPKGQEILRQLQNNPDVMRMLKNLK